MKYSLELFNRRLLTIKNLLLSFLVFFFTGSVFAEPVGVFPDGRGTNIVYGPLQNVTIGQYSRPPVSGSLRYNLGADRLEVYSGLAGSWLAVGSGDPSSGFGETNFIYLAGGGVLSIEGREPGMFIQYAGGNQYVHEFSSVNWVITDDNTNHPLSGIKFETDGGLTITHEIQTNQYSLGSSTSVVKTSVLRFGGLEGVAGDGATTQDIVVAGQNLGSYTIGTVIPTGTSFNTIFQNILSTAIPATYSQPTLTLAASPAATTYEVGTSLIPILTPTFTQNDAGAVTNYTITRNGTQIFQNSTVQSHTDVEFTAEVATYSYVATAFYNAGPILNDNIGNPSPQNSIPAGSKSATRQYVGARKYWAGFSSADSGVLTTFSEVKALTDSQFHASQITITLNAPAGTRKVVVAYLASRGELGTAVVDQPFQNFSVRDIFVSNVTTVNVGGVANYSAQPYRVYHYIPDQPTPSALKFDIVIP